jgi:anti-anti-sigma factor
MREFEATATVPPVPAQAEGDTAIVYASDYLNKLSGEKIERECRQRLDAGARRLIVNFRNTEIVNSIGVSILLGVIDAAANKGASVVFSEVNADTIQLFEVLGLTRHVIVEN